MTRVVLHIGAPKTGTSFVQSVLSNNTDVLTQRGVCWPGKKWADQVRAVEDLRDEVLGKRPEVSRWDSIVEEVRRHDGDVAIISMEWLCLGRGPLARLAVESFAGHDVHVVLTMRDLGRAIPAQWQESTQNGFTWTYAEFVEGLSASRPSRPGAGEHFWSNQDWGRMAEDWSAVVPQGRFWAVTVPPSGSASGLLWQRFCTAAGIDPEGYRLDGWPNASLGAASAELMRRVSVSRREQRLSKRHRGVLKHRLAKKVLADHSRLEPQLLMPPALHPWAVTTTRRLVTEVSAVSPRLVGDLADLDPQPTPTGSGRVADPAQISDAELLEAAVHGLLGLTRPKSEVSRPPAP